MMASDNPFPESPEKSYLRRHHLLTISGRKSALRRPLNYLGLPSAEMHDVALWKRMLGQIVAVEREQDVADAMYRTAERIGVRDRTTIIEDTLVGFSDWLVLDSRRIESSMYELSRADQERIHHCRSLKYDLVNLDLCGGFLYRKGDGQSSDNLVLLKNLIRFQALQRSPFVMILTFNLRDTGKDDYENFIEETLDGATAYGWNVDELRRFYNIADSNRQPLNLRRLRFCVPTYLHREAYQAFQVRSLGAWNYKRFYHTALVFELREAKGALGVPWPPPDEIRELLHAPMTRLYTRAGREVVKEAMPAPSVNPPSSTT